MKTREELLNVLVQIAADGVESHTDAVNGLMDLLHEEAEASKKAGLKEAWVEEYEAF